MKFIVTLTFVAALSVATQTTAETTEGVDLIEKCAIAMRHGGNVASFAVPLSQMTGLDLTPENRLRGTECLQSQFGVLFYFDNAASGFISDKDDMEKLRLDREAAQRSADERKNLRAALEERQRQLDTNRQELQQRISTACYDALSTSPLQAVTNPSCQDIFITYGFDRP